MELIYAELTVVWVVAIVLGAILAVYHSGLLAYDAVKNMVGSRRQRSVNRLTREAPTTQASPCVEAIE